MAEYVKHNDVGQAAGGASYRQATAKQQEGGIKLERTLCEIACTGFLDS